MNDSASDVPKHECEEELPEKLNRISPFMAIAIILLAIVSIAMVVVGFTAFLLNQQSPATVQLTLMCLTLIMSGVFILYSILFNLFRIIERNQRRAYDWKRDERKGSSSDNTTQAQKLRDEQSQRTTSTNRRENQQCAQSSE